MLCRSAMAPTLLCFGVEFPSLRTQSSQGDSRDGNQRFSTSRASDASWSPKRDQTKKEGRWTRHLQSDRAEARGLSLLTAWGSTRDMTQLRGSSRCQLPVRCLCIRELTPETSDGRPWRVVFMLVNRVAAIPFQSRVPLPWEDASRVLPRKLRLPVYGPCCKACDFGRVRLAAMWWRWTLGAFLHDALMEHGVAVGGGTAA